MTKLGFFLMSRRGYEALKSFVAWYGADSVCYVVGSADNNVKQDYFIEIREFCANNKINWLERKNYKDTDFIEDCKIAVGWRWIITSSRRLIVMHDSLLPKFRGFAPTVNMLIHGEPSLGVTALLASENYDTGDLIAQKSVPVQYPIKINDAIEIIAPIYAELLLEIYSMLQNDQLTLTKQAQSDATYSPWLDERDYFINWGWSASKIVRFVNAVGFPFDGAKARLNGHIVNFIDVEEVEDVFIEDRSRHIGKIIFLNGGTPSIICGDGLIRALAITDAQGAHLSASFRSRFE